MAWLAFLIYAGCLGRVVVYAALERLWRGRAQRSGRPMVELHLSPADGPGWRSALWWGVGLTSLPSGLAVGVQRSLPEPWLTVLTALVLALAAGAVVCEAAAAGKP